MNQLNVDNVKKFQEEHGQRKKELKVNWNEYILRLNQGVKK